VGDIQWYFSHTYSPNIAVLDENMERFPYLLRDQKMYCCDQKITLPDVNLSPENSTAQEIISIFTARPSLQI
jgi:hypothetical protein